MIPSNHVDLLWMFHLQREEEANLEEDYFQDSRRHMSSDTCWNDTDYIMAKMWFRLRNGELEISSYRNRYILQDYRINATGQADFAKLY